MAQSMLDDVLVELGADATETDLKVYMQNTTIPFERKLAKLKLDDLKYSRVFAALFPGAFVKPRAFRGWSCSYVPVYIRLFCAA